MFRTKHPLAWHYHSNTSRYPHNMHGAAAEQTPTAPFKEHLDRELTALPAMDLPALGLGETIRRRLSCRTFTGEPLTIAQLAAILRAAYGVHGRLELNQQEFLERPVPSGGGLYPLELYILARRIGGLEAGTYHYAALHHGLEQLNDVTLPERLLSDLFLGQPYLIPAAAILVQTAVVERSLWKYEERGYRYILFEAGHVAQNINLCATALGAGSLNLGGFFDADLAALLGIDLDEEIPLYCTAIGVPVAGDRAFQRMGGVED